MIAWRRTLGLVRTPVQGRGQTDLPRRELRIACDYLGVSVAEPHNEEMVLLAVGSNDHDAEQLVHLSELIFPAVVVALRRHGLQLYDVQASWR